MELHQLEERVSAFAHAWEAARGYSATEELTVLHLFEEMGELAHEYVSRGIRPQSFSDDHLNNAIADVFMQLLTLVRLRGIDLERLVLETIEEDLPRIERETSTN